MPPLLLLLMMMIIIRMVVMAINKRQSEAHDSVSVATCHTNIKTKAKRMNSVECGIWVTMLIPFIHLSVLTTKRHLINVLKLLLSLK